MSRELGRNDPCWCGSGKKYKKCHMNRDRQSLVSVAEVLDAQQQAFGAKYCMHPLASPTTCSGGIVRAHTIQRKGGLSRIAENGHVYSSGPSIRYHNGEPRLQSPARVGIRKASTFTGFCSFHDNSTFAPIDSSEFTCSSQQVFLLQYRALCMELFFKRGACDLLPILRELDRGKDPLHQRLVQEFAALYGAGVEASLRRLERFKNEYDRHFLANDFTDVRFYAVRLNVIPEIQCSGLFQPEFDFSGNKLQESADLSVELDWMHFALIPTDHGGYAILSWMGEGTTCELFVRSLHHVDDCQLPHALVRFTFEHFENAFCKPSWWDGLPEETQDSFLKRQLAGLPSAPPHGSNCLLDDGIRAVGWDVVSRQWHGISVGG